MFLSTSILLFAVGLAAEDVAKPYLGNLKLRIVGGHIVEIYAEGVQCPGSA